MTMNRLSYSTRRWLWAAVSCLFIQTVATFHPVCQHSTCLRVAPLSGVSTRQGDSGGKDTTIHQKLPLPPGRPTAPLVNIFFDDTMRLLNPKDMKLLNRKERFGPIFKTNFLFTPTVFCTDETSIQQLAKEEATTKSLKAFFPPHLQKMYGRNSLLVQSGSNHARIRKLVMNSMTPAMITSYERLLQDSIQSLFSSTISLQNNDDNNDEYIEMLPRMRTLFMSIILQVVLGTTDVSSELIRDVEIWARGLLAPPLTFIPWSTARKAMKARQRIFLQLKELMRVASSTASESSGNDNKEKNKVKGLLATLQQTRDVETGETLNEDEIIDNLFTLVFAGSDTTSSAAVSIWIVLSQNPKLKQQLKKTMTVTTSEQGEPAAARLDAFVRAILEAYPPAPFNMRTTSQDLEVGGYRIPAKWQVAYGFAAALQGSPIPQDLMALDSSSSSSSLPAGGAASSSLAFGQGPRKCPGRYLATSELKVFTKALVQTEWHLDPDQNLEQRYTPGYFPVDKLKVKFI